MNSGRQTATFIKELSPQTKEFILNELNILLSIITGKTEGNNDFLIEDQAQLAALNSLQALLNENDKEVTARLEAFYTQLDKYEKLKTFAFKYNSFLLAAKDYLLRSEKNYFVQLTQLITKSFKDMNEGEPITNEKIILANRLMHKINILKRSIAFLWHKESGDTSTMTDENFAAVMARLLPSDPSQLQTLNEILTYIKPLLAKKSEGKSENKSEEENAANSLQQAIEKRKEDLARPAAAKVQISEARITKVVLQTLKPDFHPIWLAAGRIDFYKRRIDMYDAYLTNKILTQTHASTNQIIQNLAQYQADSNYALHPSMAVTKSKSSEEIAALLAAYTNKENYYHREVIKFAAENSTFNTYMDNYAKIHSMKEPLQQSNNLNPINVEENFIRQWKKESMGLHKAEGKKPDQKSNFFIHAIKHVAKQLLTKLGLWQTPTMFFAKEINTVYKGDKKSDDDILIGLLDPTQKPPRKKR